MNDEPRHRALLAVAVPLAALAGIALFLWSMSRILLASSVEVAPVIALLFALNILVAAALAASLGRRRGLVAAFVVAVMVPVVAAGVVGAVTGERDFHSLAEEEPGGGHGAGEGPATGPTEEPAEEPTEEPAEEPAEEPGGGGGGPTEVTIAAVNIQFDTDTMQLAANTEVTVTFDNQDAGIPHNWAMYADETTAQEIFVGEIFPGPDTRDYTFTSPDPGDYYFQCDVHPNMSGTVTVG